MSNRSMRVQRTLPASHTLVWEVWTDPEKIAQWWGPTGFTNTIRKMDISEGGEWLFTMHGPDGKNFPNKSIFREIIPFKKIKFEHFNPDYIATIIFTPTGEQTLMDWTVVFETEEMYEIVVRTFKADEGLKQNVEKLVNYLRSTGS